MAHLTIYLDLESLKIQRSGFDFKLNLTSAIGDFANCNLLASYVSHPNAMAYDMFTKIQFHYLIKTMQLYHFTDEQSNNLRAILIDNKDGFTDVQ